ncbi:hypothetical protein ACHQM5_008554 [Ranunculus cassubicifolius]
MTRDSNYHPHLNPLFFTPDDPPSHYSFTIRSFSSLAKYGVTKYESCMFNVGGYKWKLSLYPEGDPIKKVDDHISLYLVICETNSFPLGWEIHVNYRFFVSDQIRDRYLTLGGRIRRFHSRRKEWGFPKLISLATFASPYNGYLVDDTCEFGVEVFIVQNTGASETLSMLNEMSTATFSWKVEKFSQLEKETYSDVFTSGGHKWEIELYPNGNGHGKNSSLSLYLYLADSDNMQPNTEVHAKVTLRLKNKADKDDIERSTEHWFDSTKDGRGWDFIIGLQEFRDPAKGFLVDDTCSIEADVTVLGSKEKHTEVIQI